MKNLSIYQARALAQFLRDHGYRPYYLKQANDGLPWDEGYRVFSHERGPLYKRLLAFINKSLTSR